MLNYQSFIWENVLETPLNGPHSGTLDSAVHKNSSLIKVSPQRNNGKYYFWINYDHATELLKKTLGNHQVIITSHKETQLCSM